VADVESKLRQDITPAADAEPLLGPMASELVRYLAAMAMTAAATLVAIAVDSKVTIPNVSLVFVVPVIIAGVSLGLGPSLCSAVLGALSFNFFLTEPRYSLAVDDPANVWAIGLLFVVGVIASGVAFTSRQRATEAALLRRQATVLEAYSRDVVAAENTNAIVSITSEALAALFQVPVVVMLVMEDRVVSLEQVGDLEPQKAELEAARSSWRLARSCAAAFTRIWPRALTSGPWRRPKARRRSSDWRSTRTNVPRHRVRWSTWSCVFWPWCLTVNISDGRCMVPTPDKRTNATMGSLRSQVDALLDNAGPGVSPMWRQSPRPGARRLGG
jgi:hypothetical protein